jgi:hypothetical protein
MSIQNLPSRGDTDSTVAYSHFERFFAEVNITLMYTNNTPLFVMVMVMVMLLWRFKLLPGFLLYRINHGQNNT